MWSSSNRENSAEALQSALRREFWVEVDVRATRDRVLVLNHERDLSSAPAGRSLIRERDLDDLRMLCPLARLITELLQTDAQAFLHVKELDLVPDVCRALADQRAFDRCFLFADAADSWKLIECCRGQCAAARTALHLGSAADCAAARALLVDAFWLDEQAGPWISAAHVWDLGSRASLVCAVSPEVWGPQVAPDVIRETWKDWIAWGVHAVCTDRASDLDRFKRTRGAEVTR